jgi:hypothetical protein
VNQFPKSWTGIWLFYRDHIYIEGPQIAYIFPGKALVLDLGCNLAILAVELQSSGSLEMYPREAAWLNPISIGKIPWHETLIPSSEANVEPWGPSLS